MTKTELAAALGVSPSMVSRLAKRGMPTDTVERAQRWRRRHLEPGRIKGQRHDPQAPAPAAAPPAPARVPAPDPLGAMRWNAAESLRDVLTIMVKDVCALCELSPDAAPWAVGHMRRVLLATADAHWPAMPVALWVGLLSHFLADESPLRSWPDQNETMALGGAAQLHASGFAGWASDGIQAAAMMADALRTWPEDVESVIAYPAGCTS